MRAHHGIGDVFSGQGGKGPGRRQLHLHIDRASPHVERAAEDEREPEDVVDLVRIVGTPGSHEDVTAGVHRLFPGDLRVRIGHRQHERLLVHRDDHLLRNGSLHRQAHENVGAAHGVVEGPHRSVDGVALLELVHPRIAAGVDDAARIAHHDVVVTDAQALGKLGAGNTGRAGAVDDQPHLRGVLPGQFQPAQEGRSGDDRGAVLIVVEDGNVHLLAELGLDVKAVRSLDVLEVDAAEGGLEGLHHPGLLLRGR